jgi:hypothetical protein
MKMTNPFSRISENTLFSLVIAAFIGWIAVSAASGPAALSQAPADAVAQVVAVGGNS